MAGLSTFAFAAGILGTVVAFSVADVAPMVSAPGDPAGLSRNDDLILIGSRSVTVSKSTS